MLDQLEAAFSLLDRLKKWRHAQKNPLVESVSSRYVRLFEAHGIHRNQIPRFVGHGLTLKDVQDDASLLAKLDEVTLEAACSKFAIRREWLDGADAQIHLCHDFYKQPQEFAVFLAGLKSANPDGNLHGVVLAPRDPDWNAEALLVLQETIGSVGDKPVYRHHLCNNWKFTYWKARAFLTACVAIAWRNGVYVHGRYLPKKAINQLAEGNTLLCRQGENAWHDVKGSCRLEPEDMALHPSAFLAGVDPERDDFGIRQGLQLWLDLAEEGLMETGIRPIKANPQEAFRQELAKYLEREDRVSGSD